MNEIRQQRLYFEGRMHYWYSKVKALEEVCPHSNVDVKLKGDSGNWCPAEDSYWVEVDCLDCGFRGSYDSKDSPDLYRYWCMEK